jgi:hypothetical protein
MRSDSKLSLAWLERAREAINADKSFRRAGSVDAEVGLRCGDAAFLVSFRGFACSSVREVGVLDLRDADFVVEMSVDQWQRFLAGLTDGRGRSLVDLDTTDGVVKAAHPRRKLDFLRYHTSVQAFFDAGATALARTA